MPECGLLWIQSAATPTPSLPNIRLASSCSDWDRTGHLQRAPLLDLISMLATATLGDCGANAVSQLQVVQNLREVCLDVVGNPGTEVHRKIDAYGEFISSAEFGLEPGSQSIPDFARRRTRGPKFRSLGFLRRFRFRLRFRIRPRRKFQTFFPVKSS